MKRFGLLPVLFVAPILIAVGCGGGAASTPTAAPVASATPAPVATPAPTATQVPTATTAPTATIVPVATPTPAATQVPTATTVPTATAVPDPTATAPPPPPTATILATATLVPGTAEPRAEALISSSVAIGPSKDNTLYQSRDGSLSNGAGAHFFVGNIGGGDTRRALVAFDIAAVIPAGATIQSVTLSLNMSRTTAKEQPVGLRRLLADWGEGASKAEDEEGSGARSAAGDATWIHREYDTATWQTPGGDFSDTVSASTTVGLIGRYIWGSTAEMVADVQAWLDDPATNFGWLLFGNETTIRTTKRFDSKDDPVEDNRPVLAIQFTSSVSSSDGGSDD